MPGRVFGNWGFLCFRNSSPDITTAWDLHRLRIRSGCCFWNQGWYYLLPCRITLREFLRTKLKPLWGCNCEIASSLTIQDRLTRCFFQQTKIITNHSAKQGAQGWKLWENTWSEANQKKGKTGPKPLIFLGAVSWVAAQVATFFTPLVPPSDRSELRCLVKRVGWGVESVGEKVVKQLV